MRTYHADEHYQAMLMSKKNSLPLPALSVYALVLHLSLTCLNQGCDTISRTEALDSGLGSKTPFSISNKCGLRPVVLLVVSETRPKSSCCCKLLSTCVRAHSQSRVVRSQRTANIYVKMPSYTVMELALLSFQCRLGEVGGKYALPLASRERKMDGLHMEAREGKGSKGEGSKCMDSSVSEGGPSIPRPPHIPWPSSWPPDPTSHPEGSR